MLDETHRAPFPIDARINRRQFVRIRGGDFLRARVPLRFSDACGPGHESADYRTENCRFHSCLPR
jgi:hypothetical protein